MTIKISERDFSSLLRLVERSQTDDGQNQYVEIFFEYPKELGQGYILDIKLRQGFWLTITNCQRREYLLLDSLEWQHPLQFRFHISGNIYSRNYGAIATGGSALCDIKSPRTVQQMRSLFISKISSSASITPILKRVTAIAMLV